MALDSFEYRPPAQTAPPFVGIYDVCTLVNKNNANDSIIISDHAALITGQFVCVEAFGIHDAESFPTPQFTFVQTETIGDNDKLTTFANADGIGISDNEQWVKP